MKYLWWIAQVLCLLISIFFFIFGIDLIRGAYGLDDPFSLYHDLFCRKFYYSDQPDLKHCIHH